MSKKRKHYPFIILCIILIISLIDKGFSKTPDSLSYVIVNSIPSPGPGPQGLAWDGEHLWVNDDSTDTIYKRLLCFEQSVVPLTIRNSKIMHLTTINKYSLVFNHKAFIVVAYDILMVHFFLPI